jgi:pimeloyl-ACP methyl ester carboxylesterase
MARRTLQDATGSFEVTVLEAREPSFVVLFAVGGGGNPERHRPLLSRLVERGASVVAPHFERLSSPVATAEHLLLRASRLSVALDALAPPDVRAVGLGHSIGAAMLLALAGALTWTRARELLPIAANARLQRLALMAPATGFFQAPFALDALSVPVLAWAGTNDVVTPPMQAEYLQTALEKRVPVEVRVVEGAGHFSFMDVPPPQTSEPLPDRDAFLARLAVEVCEFLSP